MQDQLNQAAEALAKARRVCAFTGAGISAESGIDTFRDEGGLWEQFPPDRFATLSGLAQVALTRPSELARFAEAVLRPVAEASPNPGHEALAALEEDARVTVVTQNVDRLHQSAGSSRVWEVHGSLFEIVDERGERLREVTREELLEVADALVRARDARLVHLAVARATKRVLGFTRRSLHRPRIVLFGEDMAQPDFDEAQAEAASCDVLLIVGTSGEVWPAAALPGLARERGATVVGVGPERGRADVWLEGKAGEVLPALVSAQRLLRETL
jgi:NAD-dependent deacetylase